MFKKKISNLKIHGLQYKCVAWWCRGPNNGFEHYLSCKIKNKWLTDLQKLKTNKNKQIQVMGNIACIFFCSTHTNAKFVKSIKNYALYSVS